MTREAQFRRVVWGYYRERGRHALPWRNISKPLPTGRLAYQILVSEIMLQQTQVDRVLPFYNAFIRRFPNAKKLARASLSSVLRAWQGLGYNRRAKMLHLAAKDIAARGFPKTVPELERLPGVGHYTARAVAAFAFNADVVMVETNIRTAIIHNFFLKRKTNGTPIYGSAVSDREIGEILERVLPKGHARKWYWALMDYGAHLKRSGVALNGQSSHYTKQSKFEGSARQARGAILRALARRSATEAALLKTFPPKRAPQVRRALIALSAEGLIEKTGRTYCLAS